MQHKKEATPRNSTSCYVLKIRWLGTLRVVRLSREWWMLATTLMWSQRWQEIVHWQSINTTIKTLEEKKSNAKWSQCSNYAKCIIYISYKEQTKGLFSKNDEIDVNLCCCIWNKLLALNNKNLTIDGFVFTTRTTMVRWISYEKDFIKRFNVTVTTLLLSVLVDRLFAR